MTLRIGKTPAMVLGFSLLLTMIHFVLARDILRVSFEVEADQWAVAQIYWDTGYGFREHQRRNFYVEPAIVNRVTFAPPGTSEIRRIRIDPVKHSGAFALRNVRVDRLGSWLPLPGLGYHRLDLGETVATNQIEVPGDSSDPSALVAAGGDPYLIWAVPGPRYPKQWVFIINLLAIASTLGGLLAGARLIAGGVRAGSDIEARAMRYSMVCLAFYPTYWLVSILTDDLVDLRRYTRWFLFATCLLAGLFYLLALRRRLVPESAVYFLGCGILAAVIVPDVLYHLGIWHQPLFATHATPPYHWRLNRSPSSNLYNSSVRYYADFQKIEDLVIRDSRFLSDRATTYYVTAALPLYGANPLTHHRKAFPRRLANVIESLCDTQTPLSNREVSGNLRFFARHAASRGLPPLRYIILNKDRNNAVVRGRCLSTRHEQVAERIAPWTNLVFRGEFLDVYKIDYSRSR